MKAAGINRSIYLTKVDADYSEEGIKTYMVSNKVRVKYTKQINRTRGLASRRSFMIVVSQTDFNSTMSEDFWPIGLECREWLNQFQLAAMVKTSEETRVEITK